MRGLIDLVLPPTCVACGKVLQVDAFFCAECDRAVDPLPLGACRHCADPDGGAEGICRRCREQPPPFTRGFAPFLHEGPVAKAVHHYKYEDHPELAAPLGKLLARAADAYLHDAPTEICVIPLHRERFYERKSDQAELLGRALARASGRAYVPGALERVGKTPLQAGLSKRHG